MTRLPRCMFLVAALAKLFWTLPAEAQWTHMWTLNDTEIVDPAGLLPSHVPVLIADFDVDGRLEVVTTRLGPPRLVVLDAETNAEEYSYTFQNAQSPSLRSVNVDADLVEEILVIWADNTGQTNSSLFDANPGVSPGSPAFVSTNTAGGSYVELWNSMDGSVLGPWGSYRGIDPVMDVDADGRLELLALNSNKTRLRVVDGLTGYVEFESAPSSDTNFGKFIPRPSGGAYVYFMSSSGGHLIAFSGPVGVHEPVVPLAILAQPTPNPSTGSVSLRLSIARQTEVLFKVFSVDGRLVRKSEPVQLPTGLHSLSWDGRTAEGASVAAGTYFIEVLSEGKTMGSRKAVVLK